MGAIVGPYHLHLPTEAWSLFFGLSIQPVGFRADGSCHCETSAGASAWVCSYMPPVPPFHSGLMFHSVLAVLRAPRTYHLHVPTEVQLLEALRLRVQGVQGDAAIEFES